MRGCRCVPTADRRIPLARAREEFAPEMRDGFLLVPRLATHEDASDSVA